MKRAAVRVMCARISSLFLTPPPFEKTAGGQEEAAVLPPRDIFLRNQVKFDDVAWTLSVEGLQVSMFYFHG